METTFVAGKTLAAYQHLFPPAQVTDTTVKRNALVEDTVTLIPKIVKHYRWQAKKYVDAELRGLSEYQACEKLWYFVKNHFRFQKDEARKEQLKTPRRFVHDGFGDCDDGTIFISCCLSWLSIPVIIRISKNTRDYFQHVYPVVPLVNGKYITIDFVVHAFNYEAPYKEIADYPMDLEILDGIEGYNLEYDELGALKLFGKDGALTKVANKVTGAVTTAAKAVATTTTNVVQNVATAVKENAGTVLHAVNKVNPATVVLRAGVLASMKLNVMNVPGRLKWAYLSDAAAQAKGTDPAKLAKLREIMTKLENIFHGAGGEKTNLKEAILTGKGNKDKSVAGLNGEPTVYQSLTDILGTRIVQAENLSGLEGMLAGVYGLSGGLGEVVTATAIAAASGAMATIAALIKNLGNIFKPGSAGSNDFAAGDSETGVPAAVPVTTTMDAVAKITSALPVISNILPALKTTVPEPTNKLPSMPAGVQRLAPAPVKAAVTPVATLPVPVTNILEVSTAPPQLPAVNTVQTTLPAINTAPPPLTTSNDTNTKANSTTGDFWKNNWKWIVPVGVVGTGLIVTAVVVSRNSHKPKAALAGLEEEECTCEETEPKLKPLPLAD